MALSDLSAGGDGAGPGLRELRKRRIPKAILCTRFTSALRAGLPDRACDERHTGRVLVRDATDITTWHGMEMPAC